MSERTLILFKNENVIIPDSVTSLTFGDDFNQKVIIPDSVETLIFGDDFNQQVFIPDSVETLIFGDDFNQQVFIPDSVTFLKFGCKFNQNIIIPNLVKTLIFGDRFNQEVIIPDSVTSLTFGDDFNKEVSVPDLVETLKFGHDFNKDILIPDLVETLSFGYSFNKEVIIPNSIKTLEFDFKFNQELKLHDSLKRLAVYNYYKTLIVSKNTEVMRHYEFGGFPTIRVSTLDIFNKIYSHTKFTEKEIEKILEDFLLFMYKLNNQVTESYNNKKPLKKTTPRNVFFTISDLKQKRKKFIQMLYDFGHIIKFFIEDGLEFKYSSARKAYISMKHLILNLYEDLDKAIIRLEKLYDLTLTKTKDDAEMNQKRNELFEDIQMNDEDKILEKFLKIEYSDLF